MQRLPLYNAEQGLGSLFATRRSLLWRVHAAQSDHCADGVIADGKRVAIANVPDFSSELGSNGSLSTMQESRNNC